MKFIISISLIILITYPQLMKVGIIVNWKINQQYIVKNLCINRTRPQLHCDGKCQLMKMIQKAEDDNKKAAEFPLAKFKNLSFDEFNINGKSNPTYNYKNKAIAINSSFYRKSFYSYQFSNSCFHPPQYLV